MVMDQLTLFHKPNKKVRSEKKIYHFIIQTKHTLCDEGAPRKMIGSKRS
jgi:hypothetical protein